ncbi:DUF2314 domain-containing protein [Chryseobacterium shigense]|uniref:Uncharacterized protein YegJ (DUF2314 family) n=1 Tax=Chryseobacterium shigense TaxID=297244 RepID=A0A841N6P9_9FLAO|nr:DUF2314 domain-containing protein [Chryseobacterium shigense]MBB6372766.1 uncharacterized protein YegJ (DUF2314 family) [Chryseobacterium shigense]
MNNSAKIEEDNIYQYNLYKAKNTLWYFNDLIITEVSGYNSVKFKNNEDVYVWLENVKIEGNYYLGNLAENGISQKIMIDNVIDWMIIEDGRLIGGYTIRHYRNTLDDEAKLNFDIDFGVKIDDGNDFFKPDSSTPEGVIIKIENFYSDENLQGVISCKDFEMEAKNLLEERGAIITEEIKNKIKEALKSSLVETLQSNEFPNFENIERCFTLLEEKQDQRLIEEKVIYQNGNFTFNKLWVWRSNEGEWKVLNLVE